MPKYYKKRKYSAETMAQAVELYAQGKTLTEIAEELKIPKGTICGWYDDKYPENWAEKRERRIKTLSEKLEKESLETYKKATIRQQHLLRSVQAKLASRIVNSTDDDLTTSDALKSLPEAIKEERKLYADLQTVLHLENKGGQSFGIGAKLQDKEGNTAQVMGYLTNAFERIHGQENGKPDSDDSDEND